MPSFEDLAAPPADAPTRQAAPADAPSAEAPTLDADAPTPPPSGPPVLRVVPPAEPEPAPAPEVDDDDAPQARPVRRAAGGRDWADVLMGSAPPADPRRD